MSRGTASTARGVYRPAIEPVYVHTTADQSNSTLVLADVAELSWPILANATYVFEFFVWKTSAATTTGMYLGVNGPAAPTAIRFGALMPTTGAGVANGGGATYLETLPSTAMPSTTVPYMDQVAGYLANGANAGTLTLRFRSEIDTSAVTIWRGSWGRLTRLG